MALIDRKINKYIGDVDGIVKKLEKDKYFIVLRKDAYKKLKEDKFSLLEEVKQVNIGNSRSATLSIGLGLNTGNVCVELPVCACGNRSCTCQRRRSGSY